MTELFLYQTVHLHRGRPRLLPAHTAILGEAAKELFGIVYTPDLRQLESRIAAVAEAERYPRGVSWFVRIELTAAGQERLIPAGTSLYDGYALRSVMPDAVFSCYELPLTAAPTSVREAAAMLTRFQARQRGGDILLQANASGVCLTADDAPLFAVKGSEIFTAPAYSGVKQEQEDGMRPERLCSCIFPSVERDLALHAIRAAKFGVHEEAFSAEALPGFEELFYVDHRGVTALGHCNDTPYMSFAAERVAEAMEGLFPKV